MTARDYIKNAIAYAKDADAKIACGEPGGALDALREAVRGLNIAEEQILAFIKRDIEGGKSK